MLFGVVRFLASGSALIMDFQLFESDKQPLPLIETEPTYRGFSDKDLHEISEKAFAVESVDASLVMRMFGVPLHRVKKQDVKFLKAYIRFVGPDYVKAYIQSPVRKNLSPEALKHQITIEIETRWKGYAYHDIAHTIAYLFQGRIADAPASLIPDFLRSENPNSVRHAPDEIFAFVWPVFPHNESIVGRTPNQMKRLTALIESSKTFDEFYINFINDAFGYLVPQGGRGSDHELRGKRLLEEKKQELLKNREPALVALLSDIYKNYLGNPRIILDGFIERAKNLLNR